jgi:hypothetical protein
LLTPEQTTAVLDEYRRTRSPFKVASQLKLNVADVWAAIDANPDAAVRNREHSGGEGREDLRPFFVAQARCHEQWDNEDPGIALARQRVCDGTHTMATHRDGAIKFLCSIPLKRKVPANPDYFKPEPTL